MLYQREIKQRLAPLKFNFDRRSRGAEHKVDRPIRRVGGHVILELVGGLAGNLAILATVIASKRHDKHKQLGKFSQRSIFGAEFGGQEVKRHIGLLIQQKVTRLEFVVDRILSLQRVSDKRTKRLRRHNEVLADEVRENHS